MSFTPLAEALKSKMAELQNKKPQFKSERAELFNELYSHYEKSYVKNTQILYGQWLKKNKYKHSMERVEQYKKDKSFRKKITIKSFCSHWFSFIKTQDIYYLNSICRDKENRNENVNQWLFWAIKNQ